MTRRDILLALLDGTLRVDSLGHRFNAGELHDNAVMELDVRSRHFPELLDKPCKVGEVLHWGPAISVTCHFQCERRFKLAYDGDRLTPRCFYDQASKKFITLGASACRCPYENFCRPFTGEIPVKGQLAVANYFSSIPDCQPEDEHTEGWSLCSLRGRENITKYKASRGVAYGQLTNTIMGVYAHPAGELVLVGQAPGLEDEEPYTLKGLPLIGEIGCDVWRWEAACSSLVAADVKQQQQRGYDPPALIDVKPGVWSFEHYYDMHRHDEEEPKVWAKLWLSSQGE